MQLGAGTGAGAASGSGVHDKPVTKHKQETAGTAANGQSSSASGSLHTENAAIGVGSGISKDGDTSPAAKRGRTNGSTDQTFAMPPGHVKKGLLDIVNKHPNTVVRGTELTPDGAVAITFDLSSVTSFTEDDLEALALMHEEVEDLHVTEEEDDGHDKSKSHGRKRRAYRMPHKLHKPPQPTPLSPAPLPPALLQQLSASLSLDMGSYGSLGQSLSGVADAVDQVVLDGVTREAPGLVTVHGHLPSSQAQVDVGTKKGKGAKAAGSAGSGQGKVSNGRKATAGKQAGMATVAGTDRDAAAGLAAAEREGELTVQLSAPSDEVMAEAEPQERETGKKKAKQQHSPGLQMADKFSPMLTSAPNPNVSKTGDTSLLHESDMAAAAAAAAAASAAAPDAPHPCEAAQDARAQGALPMANQDPESALKAGGGAVSATQETIDAAHTLLATDAQERGGTATAEQRAVADEAARVLLAGRQDAKPDAMNTAELAEQKEMEPKQAAMEQAARVLLVHEERQEQAASIASTPVSPAMLELDRLIRSGFVNGTLQPLNICIMVVGTRGDVQPFIGIGLKLKEYGHRVRIASHKTYREFVEQFKLEFYPLGGDPKVLSEFVVKHRGILPGLNINDALQQREQVREIMLSTWGACAEADPDNPSKSFRADAIIANPPCYGHIHCAEKLNVPLHMVFTMPWTPTKAFPQPFARIKTYMGEASNKARDAMNWLSYFAIEDLAWVGMASMVKHLRQDVFGLKTWNKYTNSHALYHQKVPISYIWSPTLVPRPDDWGPHIEVVGFVNVELSSHTPFAPAKDLLDFLAEGPPPVYIGFGSLIVDDPVKLTSQFLDAIHVTGQRAILQKGWGGLGAGQEGKEQSPDVLFIDSAPHDWLFKRVSAVVHHGGAGTTAAGLYAGKPTFIVPFFGDQAFWGAACKRAGVGPEPVPVDDLTTERIVEALKDLLLPKRQRAAVQLMAHLHKEDGVRGVVDHVHRTFYRCRLDGTSLVWGEAHGVSPAAAAAADKRCGLLGGLLRAPGRIMGMVHGAIHHARSNSGSSSGTSGSLSSGQLDSVHGASALANGIAPATPPAGVYETTKSATVDKDSVRQGPQSHPVTASMAEVAEVTESLHRERGGKRNGDGVFAILDGIA